MAYANRIHTGLRVCVDYCPESRCLDSTIHVVITDTLKLMYVADYAHTHVANPEYMLFRDLCQTCYFKVCLALYSKCT